MITCSPKSINFCLVSALILKSNRIIDGKQGIIYHKAGSKFLFIIFGSYDHKIGRQRPLVLINFLKDSGCDVIFLRDFRDYSKLKKIY